MESPNVLIIDDSSFFRVQLARELKDIGALVSLAEDGQHGLDLALLQPFDLIISDIEMPRLDGFTLCKKLKENPNTRSTPIILLSSMDSEPDIDKGFRVGADAYVSKSEANTKLEETIRSVLKKAKFHQGHRILVVDDSISIRSIVRGELEKVGFRVVTAENGKKALIKIKSQPPDLILSDINMPEMNGIELCKSVHADHGLSSIPFVIMSANDDRSIMRRMLSWGASAYLVKPFNLEQLVITIEKLLSDHYLLLLKEKERLDTERQMMLASISSLIVALEARDHYTRGHSEAVATLVSEMASHINLQSEEIESLTIAGRLHDLGKIGVPDRILLKPGRLTTEEFALIRQHPVMGATILGAIPSLKKEISAIRHHHERFDGTGYPDGLKGDKIPLWARMMAVADTYHALISDRPYRNGMAQDEALEIIHNVRGTQLCPECVDMLSVVIPDLPAERAYAVKKNLW